MSKFYAKYPKLTYNFDGNNNGNTSVFTNVLFRFIVSEKIRNNMFSYYDLVIPEGETISMVADKYYGDPEYHWIIAMMNNIVDPLFDWPMDYRTFQTYIKDKYGSIANAKSTVRHYVRTITRKNTNKTIIDIVNYEIGLDEYNDTPAYTLNTFNLVNGETMTEEVTTSTVSYYDYENELNDKKRNIKLIKKDYLGNIEQEFKAMVADKNPEYNSIYKRLV